MAKYFDEQKWTEAIKKPGWYLTLLRDYKKLTEKAKKSDKETTDQIKEEVYDFFERHLSVGDIALGTEGPDWDKERKSLDTVIIHHSSNQAGISHQKLSAMHLVRIYAPYYASPTKEESYIKGQPIYSNHFKNDKQVFYCYHWIVRVDGSVERLLENGQLGWHAGNWDINCRSIGIMLDNDYENSKPSNVELRAIANLIKEKYPQIPKERVFGHREVKLVGTTTCPSNLFLEGWKANLLSLL